MSAYVVDRNHIRYLVEAALCIARRDHSPSFRWWHEGSQELNEDNATQVGQMLWDECIASVAYPYEDSKAEGLPGPIDDDFVYFHQLAGPYFIFSVPQVLKAADCYSYQSCEHPGWESSSAYAFIQALIKRTYCRMEGSESAEWGAPELPENRVMRII